MNWGFDLEEHLTALTVHSSGVLSVQTQVSFEGSPRETAEELLNGKMPWIQEIHSSQLFQTVILPDRD